MAIYTTVFASTPEELLEGFSGWQPPLAEPVRREVRNPYTGAVVVVESREPVWPDDADEESDGDFEAVEIQGNYEEYLEARLPSFVRERPHWAAKGLTEIELLPLLEATGGPAAFDEALYSPPWSNATLQQFPAGFASELLALDPRMVAKSWAAAMSRPEHTHSMTGVRLTEDWTDTDAASLLEPLVVLARRAEVAQRLYLLVEP